MAKYHIYNPTPARRIIYDGSLAQHKIQIGPGETKHDVELAPHIAAGFRDGSDGDRSDLWLRPADAVWNPPPLSSGPFPASAPIPQFKEKPVPQPDYPRQMDAIPIAEVAPPIPEGLPPAPLTMPPGYKRYEAPPIVDPVEAAIKADAEADIALTDLDTRGTDTPLELLPENPPPAAPKKRKKKKGKRKAKPKPAVEPTTDDDQRLAEMRAARGN